MESYIPELSLLIASVGIIIAAFCWIQIRRSDAKSQKEQDKVNIIENTEQAIPADMVMIKADNVLYHQLYSDSHRLLNMLHKDTKYADITPLAQKTVLSLLDTLEPIRKAIAERG